MTSPEYLGLGDDLWPVVRSDVENIFAGDILAGDDPMRPRYRYIVLEEGIGSGKGWTFACIIARWAYLLGCLKNPQRHWNLADSTKLAFWLMSTTATQAKDIIYNDLRAILDNSPWFQANMRYRQDLESRISFEEKNIHIIPGNSSAKTVAGYAVLASGIDEADHFGQPGLTAGQQTKDNAQEVFDKLDQRRVSRVGECGMIVCISDPSTEGGFMERLRARAAKDPSIYCRHRALWEAKPKEWRGKVNWCGDTFYDEKIQMHVPIELKGQWDASPHAARRALAARPSAAVNPFMDGDKLKDLMAASRLMDPVAKADDSGYPLEWHSWFKPTGARYYIHVDLGATRCACGIVMGHNDRESGRPTLDYIGRIIGSPANPVDFDKVLDIIYRMRQHGFSIAMVSYDGWESMHSRSKLTARGIENDLLSTVRTLEPYETYAELVNRGLLDVYHHEWLLRETYSLELIDGKKVEHALNRSKDVTDAAAGVSYWLGKEIENAPPASRTFSAAGSPSRVFRGRL